MVFSPAVCLTANNCIFWNNKDSSGYTLGAQSFNHVWRWHCTESHNDIQGLTFLNRDISSDPAFAQGIDAASAPTTNGDFHVGPCSLTINMGYNPDRMIPLRLIIENE